MEDKGILFYSNNPYPIPLLVVAIYSLRKYYDGRIHVVFGANTPDSFKRTFSRNKMEGITFADVSKKHYTGRASNSLSKEWYEKPFIIQHESPFELTQYYDCDHVFYQPFNHDIFDLINKHDLVTAMEIVEPSRAATIKKEIKEAVGLEIEYLNRVNGGCVGYKKSSEKINIWTDYLCKYRAYNNPRSKIKYNAEEFGLATTIALGHGKIIDSRWSYCYPKMRKAMTESDGNWAIHFVASRWTKGTFWLESFKEAYDVDFFQTKSNFKRYKSYNPFIKDKESVNFIKGKLK